MNRREAEQAQGTLMSAGPVTAATMHAVLQAMDGVHDALDIGTPETPVAVRAALEAVLKNEDVVAMLSVALMNLRLARGRLGELPFHSVPSSKKSVGLGG